MSASLRCTQALHDELAADATGFAQLELLGHQAVEADDTGPADVLEVRACACGSTVSRLIGAPILSRLDQARRDGDAEMAARCCQALAGDRDEIAALRAAAGGAL